jgi:opacity protein-like surface antigen
MLAALMMPAAALAGNNSIVMLGIGTHTAVSRASGASPEMGAATAVGQGLSARLRLLYVLGLELSYDLNGLRNRSDLNVPAPTYQWSGLFYLVPHSRFSLFLLGGFGATSAGDLFSAQGATTSYHGGAGIEIGITKNWIVSADFRVNLPAYSQAMERGKRDGFAKQTLPSVGDYYNLDSWQMNLGVRFYL